MTDPINNKAITDAIAKVFDERFEREMEELSADNTVGIKMKSFDEFMKSIENIDHKEE